MLSIHHDARPIECPVCFETELTSPQLVYSSCCFQKVCSVCDRMLTHCVHCRTKLGNLRIRFGEYSFDYINTSILRLLPAETTVNLVFQKARQFFPSRETQLTRPLAMQAQNSAGRWSIFYNDTLASDGHYYLESMRLPHKNLTDSEVESWIIALLVSGGKLTTKPLTEEEIHRKCTLYAARLYPMVLSQEYIHARMKSLTRRGYCTLDKAANVYRYQY